MSTIEKAFERKNYIEDLAENQFFWYKDLIMKSFIVFIVFGEIMKDYFDQLILFFEAKR